jgi:hypothetical protein
MTDRYRHGVYVCLIVLIGSCAVAADLPASSSDWKFDQIHLKNGAVLKGMIVEETQSLIRFHNVRRRPGRPTVVIATTIRPTECTRVERLSDLDRKTLQQRILDLEKNTPQAERERMESLTLEVIAWGEIPDAGRRYTSDHFILTSNAPEEIIRRAAVRLEQIYAAYIRYLPPRHAGGKPTSVQLIIDMKEYERIVGELKQPFVNPAFFDPSTNRIVCASDVRRLGLELSQVRLKHSALRKELDKQASELSKLYTGKELKRVLEPIEQTRIRIANADRLNEALFDKETRQLFAMLYHEAFHAYVDGFVHPKSAGELPRWLNEGLAQIFETALVEAGELRVGHADSARLTQAKDLVRKNTVVSIAELIRSGSKQFVLAHLADRASADAHYVSSWAWAFYLTFEKRLLGSESLDRYVSQLKNGRSEAEAFEEFVGQKLTVIEEEFRKYVQQLQPDGTVAVIKP